jgi:hypothetical protein
MGEKCSRKDGGKFESQFSFFQTFFIPFSTVIVGKKCDGKYFIFFTAFYGVHKSEAVKTFLTYFSPGIKVKNLVYTDSSFSVKNVKSFTLSFPAQNTGWEIQIFQHNLQ